MEVGLLDRVLDEFADACWSGDLVRAHTAFAHAGGAADKVAGLQAACHGGHLPVVQWLVTELGADLHCLGDLPIQLATQGGPEHGRYHVAQWLVEQDPAYTAWPADATAKLQAWERDS